MIRDDEVREGPRARKAHRACQGDERLAVRVGVPKCVADDGDLSLTVLSRTLVRRDVEAVGERAKSDLVVVDDGVLPARDAGRAAAGRLHRHATHGHDHVVLRPEGGLAAGDRDPDGRRVVTVPDEVDEPVVVNVGPFRVRSSGQVDGGDLGEGGQPDGTL